jgi:hypothetical protein
VFWASCKCSKGIWWLLVFAPFFSQSTLVIFNSVLYSGGSSASVFFEPRHCRSLFYAPSAALSTYEYIYERQSVLKKNTLFSSEWPFFKRILPSLKSKVNTHRVKRVTCAAVESASSQNQDWPLKCFSILLYALSASGACSVGKLLKLTHCVWLREEQKAQKGYGNCSSKKWWGDDGIFQLRILQFWSYKSSRFAEDWFFQYT